MASKSVLPTSLRVIIHGRTGRYCTTWGGDLYFIIVFDCMSDVEITKLSGLLNLMENGDQIMADKGFVLNNILKDTGVSMATPHFCVLMVSLHRRR